MSENVPGLGTLIAFVQGDLPVPGFEQCLYHTADLEGLLSSEPAPPYCQSATTLFEYLIGLDYTDPGDIINAQGALADMLARCGADVTPSPAAQADFDLIRSAQPAWLDADPSWLAALLEAAPEGATKERRQWLRRRILHMFRYVKSPPSWLQSPAWPVRDAGPLVFLGQFEIAEYFHDTAAAYVFHDPATGECVTVVQVA